MREVEVYDPLVSFIDSDKDVHFTTELAQNAGESESLGSLKCNGIIIESVIIQSDQNLSWDVLFFRSPGCDDTDLDADFFIERVSFDATDGVRVGAANQYYYAWTGLHIPYHDDAVKCQLYAMIVNRSAASKTAGASGEVKLTVSYKPDGGKPGGV
jgi:hypothetical protein